MTANEMKSQAELFYAQYGQEEYNNGWRTQYLSESPKTVGATNHWEEMSQYWGFPDGSRLWITPGQVGNTIYVTGLPGFYVSTTYGTSWAGKRSEMDRDYPYGDLRFYYSEREANYALKLRRAGVRDFLERPFVDDLMIGRSVMVEGNIVHP